MSTPEQPDAQNLYSQYQAAVRQLQYYEQQEMQFFGVLEELALNLQTLKGIEENSGDSEIIIPLGGIILLKANLLNVKEVLLNIGSNIMVPSTISKAEESLNVKIKEMQEILQKIQGDKQQLEAIANKLQTQLNQLNP